MLGRKAGLLRGGRGCVLERNLRRTLFEIRNNASPIIDGSCIPKSSCMIPAAFIRYTTRKGILQVQKLQQHCTEVGKRHFPNARHRSSTLSSSHSSQPTLKLLLGLQTRYSRLQLGDLSVLRFQRESTNIATFFDSLSFEVVLGKDTTDM